MYSNEMYHAALNILSTREEQLNDYDEDALYHHGVLGQKWGIRRYQNEDGTLTEAGKKRYTLADKLYEEDKAKYGFKDKSGNVQKKYREYFGDHKGSRFVNNISSLGTFDKALREHLHDNQTLATNVSRAQLNLKVIGAQTIAAIAGINAYKVGKAFINDPAIRARMGAHYREFMNDWSTKRHVAGAAVEGAAKAAGHVHGKFQNVKEGIRDAVNRRKQNKGFVKATGFTVPDKPNIIGYLPGR